MRIVAALLSLVVLEQTVLAARVCGNPCLEAARLSYRECRRDAAETHVTSRAFAAAATWPASRPASSAR